MQRSLLLPILFTLGCATADEVKQLKEEVATLKTKVETLEKAPAAKAASGAVDQAAETAAQAILKEVTALMGKNEIPQAKAKLKEMSTKYSATKTYTRRAKKIEAELEVFGKAAPDAFKVEEWYTGNAGNVDFAKGTTLLVFWEVWCPHCKREVPNIQKTYDEYSKKGLQVVGLTKLTRSSTKDKVVSFLQENNVSYPTAKESGDLSRHFNVSGIPAAAVVKDGKVVWRGHPARLSNEMLDGWL